MWKPNRDLLTEACYGLAFDISEHPWLEPGKGRLPGKLEHVGLLAIVLNALEGFGYEREWPVIYPLLSQPVVELCLRIPTWLWCEGGINRAVARHAYRDALPELTVQRRSKGTFDRLGIELIEQQRHAMQEFICGGALAATGLIKADDVREAIRGMASYQDLTWARILTFVDVEAWIRARS
jgi:asparagine synthase (glutamine-hydrolysing)